MRTEKTQARGDMGELSPYELEACCRIGYGHPVTKWLLGDSFHPGGLQLTSTLAGLLGIDSSSRVLDVGSGLGASAVHLADTLGCRVTGVTIEQEGAAAGYDLAKSNGVEGRMTFVQGDIQSAKLEEKPFDFALMECVLSILLDKERALRNVRELLKPRGRLGLTDVTVNGPLPPELEGVLGTAGCIGGARSISEYGDLLSDAGFTVEHTQDRQEAATTFLRDISGKLMMAEVAAKLGKLPIGNPVLSEAKRLLSLAQELVRDGTLGYGLLVARKP